MSTFSRETAILKIGVLVYNHAPYLRETISSLLLQKTKFIFEIYIFEDYSTDNSREILQEIVQAFPDKIKLVFNSKNLGDFLNLRLNFKHLDSKYIALLDGDDKWDNENKIEQMISFLETHPETVGTSHNVRLEFDDGRPAELLNKNRFSRPDHTIEDLISGYCYHHTSALIFRNVFKGRLPKMYFHPSTGDWFFSMMFTQHGTIHYFDNVWSIYRIHQKGFWSKISSLDKTMLNLDSAFHYNRLLDYKYDAHFARIYSDIANLVSQQWKNPRNCLIIFKYLILLCTLKHPKNRLHMLRKLFRPIFLLLTKVIKVKIR